MRTSLPDPWAAPAALRTFVPRCLVALSLAAAMVAGVPSAAETLVRSSIDANAVWTPEGSPYLIQGSLSIAPSVTLTLEPGTVVKLYRGGIYVEGTLEAPGTAEAPVTFTSSQDSPAAGDWLGIYLGPRAGASALRHCRIRYAGGETHVWPNYGLGQYHGAWRKASVYIDGCSPVFEDASIDDSEGCALELYGGRAELRRLSLGSVGDGSYMAAFDTPDTYPIAEGNTASGTGKRSVLVSGTVTQSGTWPSLAPDVPYFLGDSLTIAEGAALTLGPGAGLESQSASLHVGGTLALPPGARWRGEYLAGIYVTGTLRAEGTAQEPITFTTRRPEPSAGSWKGIYLGPEAGASVLRHCRIQYAGGEGHVWPDYGLGQYHGAWRKAAVYIDGCSPTLEDTEVTAAEGNSLEAYGSAPTITRCRVEGWGGKGLRCESGSRPVLQDVGFSGSASYPVSLDMSSIPAPSGVTFEGNTRKAVELRGGTVTGTTTWPNWGPQASYVLVESVSVAEDATLTLAAGVVVKAFRNGLYSNGTLKSEGPVTLTSIADTTVGGDARPDPAANQPAEPSAGDWRGLYLGPKAGASVLQGWTIRYAGGDGPTWPSYGLGSIHDSWRKTSIYVDGCDATITGCTIEESKSHGMELWPCAATVKDNTVRNVGGSHYPFVLDSPSVFLKASGNKASGTGLAGISVGGDSAATGTWPLVGTGLPYVMLRGALTIPKDATLTLGDGVEIRGTVTVKGTLATGATATTTGALLNEGTLDPGAPAGVLRVSGSLTQSATGSLRLQLGSGGAGERDRLEVGGEARLAGTLSLSALPSFHADPNSRYAVVKSAGLTGEFSPEEGLRFSDQQAFHVEYGKADVVLESLQPGFTYPWVRIVGRTAVRSLDDNVFTLLFGNRGDVEARVMPVIDGIPKGATWSIEDVATNPGGDESAEVMRQTVVVEKGDALRLLLPACRVRPNSFITLRLHVAVPTTTPFELTALWGE